MMLLAGLVLTIVVALFLKPMMIAFGATDNVLDYALTYTRNYLFGISLSYCNYRRK